MKLSLVARALSCFVMITGGCARGSAPGVPAAPAATTAVSEQPDTTAATAPAATCAAERKQFVPRIVRPGENRNDAPPPAPPDGKLADSGPEPGANEAAPAAEQLAAGTEGDLDKNVIRRIMRSKLPEITLCYERVLLREPELAGTVVVSFQIQPDGKVVNAQAEGVHEEVAACVAGVAAALQFPRPKGGGLVQVRYPFTFRPTGG